jgi:hypothetical protein
MKLPYTVWAEVNGRFRHPYLPSYVSEKYRRPLISGSEPQGSKWDPNNCIYYGLGEPRSNIGDKLFFNNDKNCWQLEGKFYESHGFKEVYTGKSNCGIFGKYWLDKTETDAQHNNALQFYESDPDYPCKFAMIKKCSQQEVPRDKFAICSVVGCDCTYDDVSIECKANAWPVSLKFTGESIIDAPPTDDTAPFRDVHAVSSGDYAVNLGYEYKFEIGDHFLGGCDGVNACNNWSGQCDVVQCCSWTGGININHGEENNPFAKLHVRFKSHKISDYWYRGDQFENSSSPATKWAPSRFGWEWTIFDLEILGPAPSGVYLFTGSKNVWPCPDVESLDIQDDDGNWEHIMNDPMAEWAGCGFYGNFASLPYAIQLDEDAEMVGVAYSLRLTVDGNKMPVIQDCCYDVPQRNIQGFGAVDEAARPCVDERRDADGNYISLDPYYNASSMDRFCQVGLMGPSAIKQGGRYWAISRILGSDDPDDYSTGGGDPWSPNTWSCTSVEEHACQTTTPRPPSTPSDPSVPTLAPQATSTLPPFEGTTIAPVPTDEIPIEPDPIPTDGAIGAELIPNSAPTTTSEPNSPADPTLAPGPTTTSGPVTTTIIPSCIGVSDICVSDAKNNQMLGTYVCKGIYNGRNYWYNGHYYIYWTVVPITTLTPGTTTTLTPGTTITAGPTPTPGLTTTLTPGTTITAGPTPTPGTTITAGPTPTPGLTTTTGPTLTPRPTTTISPTPRPTTTISPTPRPTVAPETAICFYNGTSLFVSLRKAEDMYSGQDYYINNKPFWIGYNPIEQISYILYYNELNYWVLKDGQLPSSNIYAYSDEENISHPLAVTSWQSSGELDDPNIQSGPCPTYPPVTTTNTP